MGRHEFYLRVVETNILRVSAANECNVLFIIYQVSNFNFRSIMLKTWFISITQII